MIRKICIISSSVIWCVDLLLLKVTGFQSATLLKKRLRKRCFFVNCANFLRTYFLLTEHLRMTGSCVICEFLDVFQNTSVLRFFYRAPRGNCYFMYKLKNLNHQVQKKTISQVLFNREVAIRRRSFT